MCALIPEVMCFSLTVSFKVGSRYIKGVWGGRPGSPISRPTPSAAPRLRHSKAMHIRGPQFSLPSPPLRPARRDLPFAHLMQTHPTYNYHSRTHRSEHILKTLPVRLWYLVGNVHMPGPPQPHISKPVHNRAPQFSLPNSRMRSAR